MTKNDPNNLLRDQARLLAARLFRSPSLAVTYREALADAAEDTELDAKLGEWFRTSGFTTDQSNLSAVFADAPKSLLAYWDGFYLVKVESTIHTLQIDDGGVQLNGLKVADAKLDDGVLRFAPTKVSSWSGEIAFEHLGWHGETSFESATVLQKSCKGRIWSGDKRPEAPNASGASPRILLGSAPPVMLAAAASASASGDTPVRWDEFIKEFGGTYDVRWTDGDGDGEGTELKRRQLSIVARGTDVEVAFTDDGSDPVTLTTKAQHPSAGVLKFDDNKHSFELDFDAFGDGVRTVSGKIYAVGATAPTVKNTIGLLSRGKPLSWDAGIQLATGLFGVAATLIATLGVLIPWLTSTKESAEIKTKLDTLTKALVDKGANGVGVMSSDPVVSSRSSKELSNEYAMQERSQKAMEKQADGLIDMLQKQVDKAEIRITQIVQELKDAQAKGDVPLEKLVEQKLEREREIRDAAAHDKSAVEEVKEHVKDRRDHINIEHKAIVEII